MLNNIKRIASNKFKEMSIKYAVRRAITRVKEAETDPYFQLVPRDYLNLISCEIRQLVIRIWVAKIDSSDNISLDTSETKWWVDILTLVLKDDIMTYVRKEFEKNHQYSLIELFEELQGQTITSDENIRAKTEERLLLLVWINKGLSITNSPSTSTKSSTAKQENTPSSTFSKPPKK